MHKKLLKLPFSLSSIHDQKTGENRLSMMQKMVVLSSFSVFSIMNAQLWWYQ